MQYCFTCSLFRPPRTSHCAECDDCVERFDHHCLWLGNCIGKRNYKFFYYLLITLNTLALVQIAYAIYYIVVTHNMKNKMNKTNYYIFITVALVLVIVIDVGFVAIFLGKLLGLHSCLLSKNLTFYEYIKKKWNKPPGKNPFNVYCCYNVFRLLCLKSHKTYITEDDKDIQNVIITSSSRTSESRRDERIVRFAM